MTRPLITLTTDFGTHSSYVAQMTGVILQRAPEATVIDLCHSVPPQNVRHAARFWRQAIPRFPDGAIHVGVVDPGVGTERRLVYAALEGQHFLVPDNGMLSEFALACAARPLPVVLLERPEFWLPNVSSTFHGRDILAPVSAYLARGGDPAQLGPADALQVWLTALEPTLAPGKIAGEVIEVDSFGNLVTNITTAHLEETRLDAALVRCGGQHVRGLARTYGMHRPGTLVALLGSQGELELAVVNGSAAQALGVGVGAEVTVETGLRTRR